MSELLGAIKEVVDCGHQVTFKGDGRGDLVEVVVSNYQDTIVRKISRTSSISRGKDIPRLIIAMGTRMSIVKAEERTK